MGLARSRTCRNQYWESGLNPSVWRTLGTGVFTLRLMWWRDWAPRRTCTSNAKEPLQVLNCPPIPPVEVGDTVELSIEENKIHVFDEHGKAVIHTAFSGDK